MTALALTIGDADGIGPEITAKFLAHLQEPNHAQAAGGQSPQTAFSATAFVVIGDLDALYQAAQRLGLRLPDEALGVNHLGVRYVDTRHRVSSSQKGVGAVSYLALIEAVQHVRDGKAQAIITGPMSKEALHQDNLPFGGQTEVLQHLATSYFKPDPKKNSPDTQPYPSYQADMLFVYQAFRLLLLTRHVALNQVSQTLTVSGVQRSLQNVVRFLQDREKISAPKLCVLGVNPHAGELSAQNSFCEEREILQPAIQAINQQFGLSVGLPVPADGFFRGFSASQPGCDCVIAAYHDQGLIPFKLLAGLQAVNVTIGLPFLRTSVSHGTAPDIAGKGIASPESLFAAVRLALTLT